MSILDRAIAAVSPTWGLRRAAARKRTEILASYTGGTGGNGVGYGAHGASSTLRSLAGWISTSGGPDTDIVENLDKLRERSRDLCMGEPLAVGALRTIRTNEIGSGLRLNSQIDARALGMSDDEALEWEDKTEREFALWADSKACDAARRCTFGELQALARFSQLVSGDVFALLPSISRPGDRYDLRVQLLEADRVCNPEDQWRTNADILGGVEVGQYGEPVAYWIASDHPGDAYTRYGTRMIARRTWSRVPAFGPATGRPLVLHLMESERPGQRRGVPSLAPVMERFKQLGRYSDAEIMAAVVSGYFTAAITSELPQTPLGQAIPEEDQVETEDPNVYQLGHGSLLGLAPGEKLDSVNPARPNAGFEPFVHSVLKQIAAGLSGMTYGLLVKEFNASYSASRAELLEAWKSWVVGRSLHAQNFCQPTYEQWLEESVARGYIEAPGFFDDALTRAAWCGAEWTGPAQGQLDPTKEVEAAKMRVAEGFSTRTRETRELTGGDWWSFNRLRAREEAARKADGLVVAPPAPAEKTPPAPSEDGEEDAA